MLIHILLLLFGLILIVKGGDWFVDSSVDIAQYLNVPRMVIGGTLVSIATTMPELIVSATASYMKDSGIAMGNAVGSAITNIGLIVGVIAVMTHVRVDLQAFKGRSLWMIASGLLMIVFAWNLQLGWKAGGILLSFAMAYLIFDYWKITYKKKQESSANESETRDFGSPTTNMKRSVGFFVLGATLVVVGSRLLVVSGIAIAKSLGVPSVIIGLSIISVGTSLPELVTAVTSARKGIPDLSIGNIIGANVLNLTMITGVASVIHPLVLTPFTRFYSFSWLAVFLITMVAMFLRQGEIAKKEGSVLLFLYTLYVLGLVFIPIVTEI